MTFSRKDPHEVLVKQIQEALTALGEMARSAAGQRVGHAVLVIPRWSHDALGTTALHKPTLKTKALPLYRTSTPNSLLTCASDTPRQTRVETSNAPIRSADCRRK